MRHDAFHLAATGGLLLAGFAFVWHDLGKTAFVNGWDGYFYLIQVRAMAEEGAMHSPDSSPVYLLLSLLSRLCGDYVLAYKALCAGLAAGCAGLSYAVAYAFSRQRGLALLVGGVVIASPSLAYFAAQFPKNLLGMNMLLLLLLAFLRWGWLARIALLGLSFIAHRLSAGLALGFVLLRSFSWQQALLLTALAVPAILAALLLPGLLHWSDLARFEGSLQATPQLTGWAFIRLMEPGAAWTAEIVLAHAVLLAVPWVLWRHQMPQRRWLMACWLLMLLLLFPFFTMDERGMGFRFLLAFMLLWPLLLPLVLDRLGSLATTGFALFLTLTLFTRPSVYAPSEHDPDYARYQRISSRVERHFAEQRPQLLIAHKGLAEFVTWQTRMDVLPWLPEYAVPEADLWRIAWGISPMEYRYYLDPAAYKQIREIGLDYALLPESAWQLFVKKASADGDAELLARVNSWENPSEIRPTYLLRKRP